MFKLIVLTTYLTLSFAQVSFAQFFDQEKYDAFVAKKIIGLKY